MREKVWATNHIELVHSIRVESERATLIVNCCVLEASFLPLKGLLEALVENLRLTAETQEHQDGHDAGSIQARTTASRQMDSSGEADHESILVADETIIIFFL